MKIVSCQAIAAVEGKMVVQKLWNVSKFLLQVQDDLQQGVIGAVPVPSDDAGKEEVIAALVTNVEAMIKADRKITALKQLQVSKF